MFFYFIVCVLHLCDFFPFLKKFFLIHIPCSASFEKQGAKKLCWSPEFLLISQYFFCIGNSVSNSSGIYLNEDIVLITENPTTLLRKHNPRFAFFTEGPKRTESFISVSMELDLKIICYATCSFCT